MPIPRHRHARTHDLRERMETTCGDRKALITFDDVIFRSVKREFASADEMVSGTGSAMCGGRFNPKGVPAVYGSLAPETAFGEAIDWYRRQGLPA